MKNFVVAATLVAAAGLMALTLVAGAGAAAKSTWYWTPGICKANLQSGGVEFPDGRTFNIAKAYCIGRGGAKTCEWSSGHRTRLYTTFMSYVRSPDGTIRDFTLVTAGKSDYRLTGFKSLAVGYDAQKFTTLMNSLAPGAAQKENLKGCALYTP